MGQQDGSAFSSLISDIDLPLHTSPCSSSSYIARSMYLMRTNFSSVGNVTLFFGFPFFPKSDISTKDVADMFSDADATPLARLSIPGGGVDFPISFIASWNGSIDEGWATAESGSSFLTVVV